MTESKGTLLIAEDESTLLELLETLLAPFAKKIITASNGADALKLVKAGGIDAILTDIQMPIMTGLQLLAEIRAVHISTPLVIITGHADKASVKEALRLNATDYLEKPFNANEVIQAVQRALTLGMALNKIEREIDLAMNSSDLPADELVKAKLFKKVIAGMKIQKLLK